MNGLSLGKSDAQTSPIAARFENAVDATTCSSKSCATLFDRSYEKLSVSRDKRARSTERSDIVSWVLLIPSGIITFSLISEIKCFE